MNEVEHERFCEDAELSQNLGVLEQTLKEQNEGKNLRCFPLASFGWKDADLDPEGCTGIKEIVRADFDSVSIKVGGHKTICFCACDDESRHDSDNNCLMKAVVAAGYPVHCSGDDWLLSFEQIVTVPWVEADFEQKQRSYSATAEALIAAAKTAVDRFQKDMTGLSVVCDGICGE